MPVNRKANAAGSFTVIEGGRAARSRSRRTRMLAVVEGVTEVAVYLCSYLFIFATAWVVTVVATGRVVAIGVPGLLGAIGACMLLDPLIDGAAAGVADAASERVGALLGGMRRLRDRLRCRGRGGAV